MGLSLLLHCLIFHLTTFFASYSTTFVPSGTVAIGVDIHHVESGAKNQGANLLVFGFKRRRRTRIRRRRRRTRRRRRITDSTNRGRLSTVRRRKRSKKIEDIKGKSFGTKVPKIGKFGEMVEKLKEPKVWLRYSVARDLDAF